jgi:hypothetical protein
VSDSPAPPVYRNTDTAPLVFFDVVAAFGALAGSIEIELAARILSPVASGNPVEFITTGRLRCSPNAATQLRNAIDESLNILKKPRSEGDIGSTSMN